jgi:Skp family chaperone for outer membrane proteins
MKIKMLIISCVAVLLALCFTNSMAEQTAAANGTKIGVVSVRLIFQDCKRNAAYRDQAKAEEDKVVAELKKLSKELEAAKAGLDTLKQGSSEHLALVKDILQKQASYQAQEEFEKKQFAMQDQRWTEQLYMDILETVQEIAKNKGLDLVLEKDKPDFPSASANDLMMGIRTHKVLYSEGCLDITSDVLAGIDSKK